MLVHQAVNLCDTLDQFGGCYYIGQVRTLGNSPLDLPLQRAKVRGGY